jgi:hypothetical protein
MAGGVIHILFGMLSAIIIYTFHFKLEFSVMIFIGNLLPDAIKFGLSAIKQGTSNIFTVQKDSFYTALSMTTSDPSSWLVFTFFILAVCTFLYHYHYIKRKNFEEYKELVVILLIGILTHLVLDVLFIENGIWF